MKFSHILGLVSIAAALAGASGCSSGSNGADNGSHATAAITISPVEVKGTVDNVADSLPDGGYHVSFDIVSLTDRGSLPLTVHSHDMFDAKDIEALDPTTQTDIIANAAPVRVNSVVPDTNEYGAKIIDINSGQVILRLEDDGLYHAIDKTGDFAYYPVGKITLAVHPTVNYIDEADLSRLIETTGIDALRNAPNPTFDVANTTVEVKDNKIVGITRIQI